MWLFYFFHFERNYDGLKSKSRRILLNRNINFIKKPNGIGNGKSHLRFANEKWDSDEFELAKKKRTIFLLFILSEGSFLNICVLSQCILYWIHFQNIHIFTLFHTHFCLFLKSSKALRDLKYYVLNSKP